MPTRLRLRIANGQFNFSAGNLQTNTKKILAGVQQAKQLKADLVVFPELALSGYPPQDFLFRKDFKEALHKALKTIAEQSTDITILLGHPAWLKQNIYNAASLLQNKKIVLTYHKRYLPNYGVFDEQRYFQAGDSPGLFTLKGLKLGILICEDLWHPQPLLITKEKGAQLIIGINASPFDLTKAAQRHHILKVRIQESGLPILYVNMVGGQDNLVFDGGSQALNAKGILCAHAGYFEEKLWPVDIRLDQILEFSVQTPPSASLIKEKEETLLYKALILAVKDYVEKNHFPGVIIGLSGGIDSALTLAIAVDALGKDRIHAVSLPSRYTSTLSKEIVVDLTKKLGVTLSTFSIEPAFQTYLATLHLDPKSPPAGIIVENIQARCRMILLMALSNQSSKLLLNCSNKSELAVGYGTLYGDLAGGFAVLKDVLKTLVYKLAIYRHAQNPLFPESLLTRPPSAELADNQKDEDKLPPYKQLDKILKHYLEDDWDINKIAKEGGFSSDQVREIIDLVNKNEYKRRQLSVGPRISHRAFGLERRYPITYVENLTEDNLK